MPDNTTYQSAAAATPPAGLVVSGEEVTTLNGSAVTAQLVQRIVHALRTADGTAVDVTAANPLPVDDADTQAQLALILTELGQKLETGGEVTLSAASLAALETISVANFPADPATSAKQDTGNTSLASILTSVDGLEAKDYATQTTLALVRTAAEAILAKIIAAPATEAKQDSILTELGQKLEPGGEVALNAATLSALETIGLDSATLTALETISIGTALPAGTNNIGDVDLASAIPAGTNNIGDVDLASAIPAGSNAIGNVNTAGLSTAAQAGTSVTVGTSSSTLVSANSARKLLVVCNDHATNILYVRLGASAAVANQGIRLNAAGGCLTIRGDEYTGEVRAIASGASTVVTVSEV